MSMMVYFTSRNPGRSSRSGTTRRGSGMGSGGSDRSAGSLATSITSLCSEWV